MRNAGLPEDKAEPAIGFDREGNPYVIRWSEEYKRWGGYGFDPKSKDSTLGFGFALREEMADFIVEHSPIEPATPPLALRS